MFTYHEFAELFMTLMKQQMVRKNVTDPLVKYH